MKQITKLVTIGKIAELAGVGVETIRFYEREGILPKPARKASGYRLFEPVVADNIRLIRELQDAGFSLAEAGRMSAGANWAATAQLIDERIQRLRDLQKKLRRR